MHKTSHLKAGDIGGGERSVSVYKYPESGGQVDTAGELLTFCLTLLSPVHSRLLGGQTRYEYTRNKNDL